MDKLTQYLNARWVLESEVHKVEFAYILSALKNSNIDSIESYLSRDKIAAYATADVNAVDQYDLSEVNIPDNSVAVISVQGTLYSWKTFDIENYIAQAINNPRIIAILLFVNTPGGMVHRIDIATSLILSTPKPVNAYITGMCCSGGIWLVSACKNILAASPLDVIGSIGVKTNYWSLKKYWEEMGIIDRDIYATDSSKKDYEVRELEDRNNDKPIIEELDFTNNLFQQTISKNLNIPFDKNSDVFKGATFRANSALQYKLIHAIGSFEDALKLTLANGLASKSKTIY